MGVGCNVSKTFCIFGVWLHGCVCKWICCEAGPGKLGFHGLMCFCRAHKSQKRKERETGTRLQFVICLTPLLHTPGTWVWLFSSSLSVLFSLAYSPSAGATTVRDQRERVRNPEKERRKLQITFFHLVKVALFCSSRLASGSYSKTDSTSSKQG